MNKRKSIGIQHSMCVQPAFEGIDKGGKHDIF